jgi:ankyrin repeat protein
LKEEYKKGLARMKKLPSPQYQLALRTMNYMARSKLLLKPEELQDALSIEPGNFTWNLDRRPPIAMILTVCLGFVIENPISGKMEFFHITLSEFFTTSDFWHDLKLDFGGCCVTYLMSEDFKQPCSNHEEAVERRRQHPFATYASRFWGDNIRGELEWKYRDVLLQFLTSDNRISCFQLLPPDTAYDTQLIGEPSEWYHEVTNSNSFAIYSCAYLRLKNIMPLLLAKDFEPDYIAPFGQRFSPLHIAVKLRDPEMCKWLIQAGADVNVRDKTGRTPLHLCWEHADSAVWEISPLLVDAGARFDISDSCGQTVLHHALQYSNSFWIQEMINTSHEFGFGKQDLDGNTALHYAVIRRYDGVVGHLLSQDANPVLKNNNGQNPLTLAMESYDQESERIVKQILVRVDEEDAEYELLTDEQAAADTYLAACAQRRASAKQAQAKSDVERSTKRSRLGQENLQPITWEAEQEDPYNLSGLLLNGTRINFFDTASDMTPLHHAVLAGHELPTWQLLAAGAKADVKDKRHGLTPLELAQREGHLDVAALFLRNGSESSGEGFVWQRKSYQIGRGMWSKHISGTELQRAYRKAKHLRKCIRMSSVWLGPGMQVWYDYLGYEPTARDSINWSSLEDSDEDECEDSD